MASRAAAAIDVADRLELCRNIRDTAPMILCGDSHDIGERREHEPADGRDRLARP